MPTRPLQVGITGGIGSGKSTVCAIFEVLKVPCYNADKRARWIMENNSNVISGISTIFGQKAYLDGKLNRDVIASAAFKDSTILNKMNEVVHPKVGEDYVRWLNQQDTFMVIKEAALLLETGSYKTLDYVVTVTAPVELRIARLLTRDPFRTAEEIKDIMERQMSEEKKIELADFQIINDEEHSLIEQVRQLHQLFETQAGQATVID